MFWCLMTCLIASGLLENHGSWAAAPVFATDRHVTTLNASEQTQVTLAEFDCTDADAGDVTTVNLTSVIPSDPCSSCFAVYPAFQCAAGVAYCLKFLPGKGNLDYDQASTYNVTVTCSDGTNSVNATVDIRLIANTPPHFVAGQTVVTLTLTNTKTRMAGTTVYEVKAADDDNDPIVFSMISSPASSFFEIDHGHGVIWATTDLGGLCHLRTISFYVNITDGFNDPVGPLAVHVTLLDSNVAPDITNLDRSLQVPEDAAINVVILSMAATDDTAVTGLSYTLQASPPANLAYFKIDGQDIKVKAALNYEGGTTQHTYLTVRARDVQGCESPLRYLHVTVTDVNEPPDLRPGYAVYSVYEGPDFGSPPLSIPWTVVEEDYNDQQHTYTIVDGNNLDLFSIDSTSGQLNVTTDYDIDNGAMASSQTLTVQVTDRGGLTDYATVLLQFKDRNDHAPVIWAPVSTFNVSNTRPAGSVLGTLNCTDEDSSFQGNNDVHITGSSSGITILPTGEIIMSVVPAVGQSFTAAAGCQDNGLYPGPLKSASPAYVSVTGVTSDFVLPMCSSPGGLTDAPDRRAED